MSLKKFCQRCAPIRCSSSIIFITTGLSFLSQDDISPISQTATSYKSNKVRAYSRTKCPTHELSVARLAPQFVLKPLMKVKFNENGLHREIGPFSATAVVIANMIGSGIFTTSGFIMAELNNPSSFLFCWLAGGIFALCGALCYGELGVRYPKAGGEYVYLKQAYGKYMGFLSGWISLFVGFSAPIAAAAMAFAAYVVGLGVGNDAPGWVFHIAGIPILTISLQTGIACGVILCFTFLHYYSLHIGTRVQNSLTILKICIIGVFVLAAIWVGEGDTAHFASTATWKDLFSKRLAVSLIFVSFAYSGWNAAAYLGGEILSPQRNLPLALIAGTSIVMVLYMALNLVFLYALSPKAMAGTLDVGTRAAAALFNDGAARWLGGAIAIGLLSVLSAMIMTGPRVYFAMARDGIFFKRFGRLSRVHHTPAASIFLQAGIAIAMVLTATFDQLLIYIGFTLSLSALMTVAGLMILRRRQPRFRGTYQTGGYPITPLLFILGNAWIMFYTVIARPVASFMGLATIGLGLAAYKGFQRKALGDDPMQDQNRSV